jgi:hypothetical protein
MRHRRSIVLATVLAVAASIVAVPLALAVSGTASSAPTAGRQRVDFLPGTTAGTFRIVPRPAGPLALLSVAAADGRQYSIVRGGTDFADPTVWLRRGAGELCWGERPTEATRAYSVRPAAVPFAAPRAAWAWSTIVLIGRSGPQSFTAPVPGETLTTGERIRRVVACVEPQFAPDPDEGAVRAYRSDEPVASQPTASAAPSVALPTASASSAGEPSVALPTASASSELPAVPDAGTFAQPEDKVTMCHATASTSNPYSLITVDQSSITKDNGHGGHTGPLFPEPGWGDVIPPFDGFPGLNWPAGSLLLEEGCVLSEPSEPVDPPDIEIDPPDPGSPMPPIYLPIVVAPPIYLPEPQPSASPSGSASPQPSASPSGSASPQPSASPSGSASPQPSASPSGSASPQPSASPSGSASPQPSASPSGSASPQPSASPSGSASPQSSASPAPTVTSAPEALPAPAPGEVRLTFTDGDRVFSVTRPATVLDRLARLRDLAKCPASEPVPGRATRGC